MKHKYDVCVVAFLDLRFDGRAKNLIDSLLQQGKSVISFSVRLSHTTEKEQLTLPNHTQIIIDIPHQRRVLIKLLTFIQSVKNHLNQIECDVF